MKNETFNACQKIVFLFIEIKIFVLQNPDPECIFFYNPGSASVQCENPDPLI